MEIFEAIRGRRSVRKFEDKNIPMQDLKKILEAGVWAPSGSNIQPWEFILVKNRDAIERIKLISPGLFGNPSALIILCINHERAKRGGKLGVRTALMDISMAAQNMMLTAYALGVGSCPVVSFNKPALKELLDIPDHVEPVLIISLGYPQFMPKPPKRRPLEEVVHIEKFGEHLSG